MAYVADYVLDTALTIFDTEANRLDITSQEPATHTEATTTYSLGNKTSITISAPTDGDTSGRKVAVSAITDGSVTANGTATHWAISDTANTRLLAAGSLTSSQQVTNGNSFTLTTFDIEIPDPS